MKTSGCISPQGFGLRIVRAHLHSAMEHLVAFHAAGLQPVVT
jgi:hypothetical protein